MSLQLSKHNRSKMIILTNEARVLKRLRQEAGLSLREAGEKIGRNHSTIVHIETGRMDPPKGERLHRLLEAYGVPNYKSFYNRVLNFKEKLTPSQEMSEIVPRLSPEKLDLVLRITKRIAEGKAVLSF